MGGEDFRELIHAPIRLEFMEEVHGDTVPSRLDTRKQKKKEKRELREEGGREGGGKGLNSQTSNLICRIEGHNKQNLY